GVGNRGRGGADERRGPAGDQDEPGARRLDARKCGHGAWRDGPVTAHDRAVEVGGHQARNTVAAHIPQPSTAGNRSTTVFAVCSAGAAQMPAVKISTST